ncbi:zinc finger CCCH domain-containing protein 37 isoform X2 [Prunus yedoensis var. nudiflora]|uniref:Zinc finger CCCH domain-containing protein 37 isoform X2 n=1 Tax=Prunus yedoensis var. nudiflora TaxID=2094558 RepID=A0A314XT29_PRUYE|nr:zinc finger CCCH domain-containing protein 37 isoform X2 [Prunus yedoensis var. nudiflora]
MVMIKFHLKTGQCKFGATCKFHHPKDILIPSAEQENTIGEIGTTIQPEGTGFAVKPPVSFSPALSGEPDCPFYFYLIGSCKYGATWARLKRT